MIFLLLALLAISMAVVVVGLRLSSKPQLQHARAVYYRGRGGRRWVAAGQVPLRTRRLAEAGQAGARTRQLTMELEPPAGAGISLPMLVGRLFGGRVREPKPLAVILVGLISLFVLGLYSLTILLPHAAVIGSMFFYGQIPPASAQNLQQNNFPTNASQALVRINQLDPTQYSSVQEYKTWAYSTCSAAAMAEVFNAYGRQYRITDVLKVEAQLGEVTPQLGLLEDVGIQRTAAQFGFKTSWGYSLSLDQVIDIANHGSPVIVSFPPDRYPAGHIVVVTGGNGISVFIADTSLYNRHTLTRTQFMQWWGGFSAIVTPN